MAISDVELERATQEWLKSIRLAAKAADEEERFNARCSCGHLKFIHVEPEDGGPVAQDGWRRPLAPGKCLHSRCTCVQDFGGRWSGW